MKPLQFILACLAGVALTGAVRAGVETDPNKSYAITPEVGPWVIYATSYVGPDSETLAHEMVLEIRKHYNLEAWVFNRGEEERRKQQEELKKMHEQYKYFDPQQQRMVSPPMRTVRVQQQCAVLIGGFRDFDTASRGLKTIKAIGKDSIRDANNLGFTRKLLPMLMVVKPKENENGVDQGEFAPVSPFLNSFVTRNPVVPQTAKAQPKEDPAYLRKLNSGDSFSVFKCRKPYTLVVAAYQGASAFQAQSDSPSFLDKLLGTSPGEKLEASAQNAHNFAEVLRKLNFEAYVLHMRGGSLVTIGGFDRPDDPRIQSLKEAMQGTGSTPGVRVSQGAQMVPNPFPIEIPR
jgi:hypothetical protein